MKRLSALLCLAFGSCTLFAIGAGVAVDRELKEGTGTQDFLATIQATWDAAREEMDELDIKYAEDFKFDFEKGSKINVTGGWIEIRPHKGDARYTRVRARFSDLGGMKKSRARANEVLDGIDARLGGAGSPQD